MEVIASKVILSIVGIVMIWIGLFGGGVSYSSKGLFPQVKEYIMHRRAQKRFLEEVRKVEKSVSQGSK